MSLMLSFGREICAPDARRRSAPFGRIVSLALALSILALGAQAHPMASDITSAKLHIHYHLIDCSLRCPSVELLSAAGVQPGELTGEDLKKPIVAKLEKWLPTQFNLEKDGKSLKPEVVAAEFQNSSQANATTCELTVHYPTDKPAERLRVTSHFVHTLVSAGTSFEMRAANETTREFDTGANLGSVWNNIVDFMQMGMEHLFTGPDHILFICTLIFALMDFKSVVKMLTGFTIGHSITLILTTFNVFSIPARWADMGIALTIIFVGVQNIVSKDAPRHRWWLVFGFGLVHGMGFSSALREVGLPEQGLVLCLLAFNLGIELAQIIIVACVYPVLAKWRWYREAVEVDPAVGTRAFRRYMNIGSALTACIGGYWLVERILTP